MLSYGGLLNIRLRYLYLGEGEECKIEVQLIARCHPGNEMATRK